MVIVAEVCYKRVHHKDTKNKTGKDPLCLQKIVQNYKFYIAFENSLCADYLTEKATQFMDLPSLPVVMSYAQSGSTFTTKILYKCLWLQNYQGTCWLHFISRWKFWWIFEIFYLEKQMESWDISEGKRSNWDLFVNQYLFQKNILSLIKKKKKRNAHWLPL